MTTYKLQSVNSQTKTQLFCQKLSVFVVLLATLPDPVSSFQAHSSRSSLPSTSLPPFRANFLKLSSSLNQHNDANSNIVDVDSSVVIPCLDQWVTLPSGEIMGVVYHSISEASMSMNDGDIIATSAVSQDDLPLLQAGMNVATISGTQYTLLNRATVEMAQHYSTLLEMNDPNAEEMPPIPPVLTAEATTAAEAAAASSRMTRSLTTSSAPSTTMTTETLPETQDKGKELLQKVKDAGVSGAISYALWEMAFWALSVPVCLVAYRSLTGHWPDFQSGEDWKQLGGEAFVFVNLARFAVPIRIGLALSTVPWVQTNLVDRFSKGEDGESNIISPAPMMMPQEGQQGVISLDQMTAMEEYKKHLQTRSPELRRQLEGSHPEPPSGMTAFEEYQQYQSNRSPELQQEYQQYQQPPPVESSSSSSSLSKTSDAMEEYQQFQQQRSPELQEQYQQYQQPPAEAQSSSSGLSAMEEYQQYQSNRDPQLQQQFQQYQQPTTPLVDGSSSSKSAAVEEYQQYQEQRSPELQEQYNKSFQQQQQQESSVPPPPPPPQEPPAQIQPQETVVGAGVVVNGAAAAAEYYQ